MSLALEIALAILGAAMLFNLSGGLAGPDTQALEQKRRHLLAELAKAKGTRKQRLVADLKTIYRELDS